MQGGDGAANQWFDYGDCDHVEEDEIPSTVFRRPPPPSKSLEDILIERVLPFLPVRPLLRLYSVNPQWHRLLSSSIFSHFQTICNRSLSGLFCCDPPSFYISFHPSEAHAIPDPLLSFFPYQSHAHVLASAGGLLCCSITHTNVSLVVCNPATRSFAELPLAPCRVDAVVLDFTPSLDNIAEEYRIICVESEQQRCRFAVFNSTDGSWGCSKPWMTEDHPRQLSPYGVAAGGKAYWRVSDRAILRYDPDGDEPSIVGLPGETTDDGIVRRLGEFGGRLCCVSASATTGDVVFDVLIEGEANGRWKRLQQFSVVEGIPMRPLPFQGGSDEVPVWVDGSVIGFSIATGERRLLCDVKESPVLDEAELLPYISTFAFVKTFGNGDEGVVPYRGQRIFRRGTKLEWSDLVGPT